MEPSLQLQRRMLEKVQRILLRDYRGIFSIILPVFLLDTESELLRDLVQAALHALDSAMASTPAASARGSSQLLFDYELVVVLRDSSPVLSDLDRLRATLLTFNHARLRFIDTPAIPLQDWTATSAERSLEAMTTNGTAIRERPFSPTILRYVLSQARVLHTPDWFIVLHGVGNATLLQPLSNLSAIAAGQLQSLSPLVTAFQLDYSPWKVYRMDYVELYWNDFLQAEVHLVAA